MASLTDDADYDAGETSENVSSPQDGKTHGTGFTCLFDEFVAWCGEWQNSLMCREIDFTCLFDEFVSWCGEWQDDDADYDAGETFENVSSP
ncbi:unnamed protein product, partial [Protopolystoma xenopodis]